MSDTYRAVFAVPAGRYTGYVDASVAGKARRFFEQWQRKLDASDFPVSLVSVEPWKKSQSLKSL